MIGRRVAVTCLHLQGASRQFINNFKSFTTMSKLITKFVMVALAVLACATLTACGDDKDDPEPIDNAPSLAGTVWV